MQINNTAISTPNFVLIPSSRRDFQTAQSWTDRQTYRQTDRQTGGRTDRQTNVSKCFFCVLGHLIHTFITYLSCQVKVQIFMANSFIN